MSIKDFILDLVFPKFCLGCAREGRWLCPACQEKILFVRSQVCPGCGKISPGGKFCRRCSEPKNLAGIIVAGYFEEGPTKELIHNFKYNHIIELKGILSKMLATALKENLVLDKNFLLTAVPLHFLRQSQRGYNQAEILAGVIGCQLKIEKNFKILKKIRKTKPQVLTEGKNRRNNLKNCFKIAQKINLSGRTIILVDDITTTGTTLQECAQVLREAGAREIWGLVVARG